MKNTIGFGLKWAALFIGLFAAQIGASLLLPLAMAPPKPDGPLTIMQALPAVALIESLVLAILSQNLNGGFIRKALVVFAVFFAVESGLSLIEAVYFNTYLKLGTALLVNLGETALIKSIVVAALGAFLWNEPPSADTEALKGLFWKVPLLSLLYVLFYFGAGALIAWQSATVRAFYGQGIHINNGELALLQIFRGAIWVGLAYLLASSLKGSTLFRGLVTGLCFAVFMALPLLYPNDAMPWAVRIMHLMEISSSNFLYGLLSVLILRSGVRVSDAAR